MTDLAHATNPTPQFQPPTPGNTSTNGPEPQQLEAALFRALVPLRARLAKERGIPPFLVLSNAVLAVVAQVRPANEQVLRSISGIGDHKLAEYGAELLIGVRQEALTLGLDLTHVPPPAKLRYTRLADGTGREDRLPTTDARALAVAAFTRGDRLGDVCVQLSRAPAGLVDWLIEYVAAENRDHLRPWLSDEKLERIRAAAASSGFARLRPVFDHLNGEVPYPLLALARGFMRARGELPADPTAEPEQAAKPAEEVQP